MIRSTQIYLKRILTYNFKIIDDCTEDNSCQKIIITSDFFKKLYMIYQTEKSKK
jgi:hypothetical protein